jgi:hypothetical protein
MKEISFEQFKSEFQTIADLVISLDEKNRAILKPRDEIKIYIESKSLYIQEIIIEELLEVYSLGGISDSYLNNKEVNYWNKMPFEAYCNFIKKRIEAKIKHFQFIDDDRIIQNLKEKIHALTTKSAKINFLLEKIRDLEGDYPKALGKILKEDDLYLFLKRELKYWEKYNELSSDAEAKKIEPLPQLSTNLTIGQRSKLFELLKEGKFIPDKTDPDCFNWALSVTDEKQLKQPSSWQSIKWNKSKMAFVELFKPYIDTITSRPANRVVEKLFLDEFGDTMKDLKSPGKDQVSGSWSDICTIIDKLKI